MSVFARSITAIILSVSKAPTRVLNGGSKYKENSTKVNKVEQGRNTTTHPQ